MNLELQGKRGDVAFVLVVVVTLAAVLSAGAVMISAERNLDVHAEEFSLLRNDIAAAESYATSVSRMIGASVIRQGDNETLVPRFVIEVGKQQSVLAISKGFSERVSTSGAVVFVATDTGYELQVESIPLTVVYEGNRLQRQMDIHVTFDGQGAVHKVYKEYPA